MHRIGWLVMVDDVWRWLRIIEDRRIAVSWRWIASVHDDERLTTTADEDWRCLDEKREIEDDRCQKQLVKTGKHSLWRYLSVVKRKVDKYYYWKYLGWTVGLKINQINQRNAFVGLNLFFYMEKSFNSNNRIYFLLRSTDLIVLTARVRCKNGS